MPGNRRSIRLPDYDYGRPNSYFITLCCHRHRHRFGTVKNGRVHLSPYGQIAHDQWQALPRRFPTLGLGEFIIMPNHIHGILCLGEIFPSDSEERPYKHSEERPDPPSVRAGLAPALPTPALPAPALPAPALLAPALPAPAPPSRPTLGQIIGAYKSLTFTACLTLAKRNHEQLGRLWLRNYYEIIIREAEAFRRITHYIRNNPANWRRDKFSP